MTNTDTNQFEDARQLHNEVISYMRKGIRENSESIMQGGISLLIQLKNAGFKFPVPTDVRNSEHYRKHLDATGFNEFAEDNEYIHNRNRQIINSIF